MPLHRFEAGGNTYNLHDKKLTDYSDNFGDTVTRTTRLPGVDGGFDEYLSDFAAREIGTIRQAFTLMSATKTGLDDLKDDVLAMLGWGRGYLYFRPSDYGVDANVERRVRARISNINMPKDESDARDLYWQRVTVIWQCAEPVWERGGTVQSASFAHDGNSTQTLTNDGNAIALPVITISCDSGEEIDTLLRIRRLRNMEEVDLFEWDVSLEAGEELVIDCSAKSVTKNGNDAYVAADIDYDHPDWFRLEPGDQTMNVISGGGSGDTATVTVEWRSAWF